MAPREKRRSVTLGLSILFHALLLLLFLQAVAARAQPRPASSQRVVIVDADAGSDDLMAIAFLLSRPDIRVET